MEDAGICFQAFIPMRREPDERSEMTSQILYGESFTILELNKKTNFSLIHLDYDNYEGWIDSKTIYPFSGKEKESIFSGSSEVTHDLITILTSQRGPLPLIIGCGCIIRMREGKVLDLTGNDYYLPEKQKKSIIENTRFSLAIFGVIIWVIDRKVKKERKIEEVGFKDALLIGFSQALALVPGVSRSGITMVMGRCLGFTREASVRFSFLLSAPIIFGSVMAGALKIFKGKEAMSFNYLDLGVGVLTSFIFGFLAIRFLIKYVSKNNFDIFVIYRLALASLILIALMYS